MDKHTIDLLKRINKCDKIDEVRDLIIDFVTDDSLVKEHNYDLPEDRVCSICSVDNFGNETWKNKDGLYHRTDGPAIKFADGEKSWWLNGTKMTEQEHRNMVYKWKDKQF